MPEQAQQALQNFFRKGNPIALREWPDVGRQSESTSRWRCTAATMQWSVRGLPQKPSWSV